MWFRKLEELSKSEPKNPTVLNSLGAIELAQKKDYARAADDFGRALREGSEEQTTFLNLATALQGQGRARDAEAVLERGVAAYPYSGALTSRLAQQLFMNGDAARARDLIREYRKRFPEDDFVRDVEKQLNASGNAAPTPANDRGGSITLPR